MRRKLLGIVSIVVLYKKKYGHIIYPTGSAHEKLT